MSNIVCRRKIQLVIEDVRPEDESLYRCVGTDFYNEEAVSETLLIVSGECRSIRTGYN